MSIDLEKLMAYADDELDTAARAEVERALALYPHLRAELEVQRAVRARLKARYGPIASEEVPERLKVMLGAVPDEESGTASLSEARSRRRSPPWKSLAAAAATFVLGFATGPLLFSEERGPVGVEDGTLVAEGQLADALETQLASAQPRDVPVRIGLTFADRNGRACRTFEVESFAGLACRGGDGWAMVTTVTVPEQASGTYRQAASPFVMATAQEMMAGPPLDADAERAARDRSWRME